LPACIYENNQHAAQCCAKSDNIDQEPLPVLMYSS
jgi:hypothetical protein